MKKKIFLIVLLGIFATIHSAKAQKKEFAQITIANTSDLNFKDKVIEISWLEVIKAYPAVDTNSLIVVDVKSKKQLVYQLEKRGTTNIQNLLIQVSIPSKQNLVLKIKKGKKMIFTPLTYARYVPERMDDFAWENDKIGYRMYGKALEATTSNALGIDIWAKRTTKLIINKWYKLGDYHKDYGEGLDFYSVGLTLGAGDIAPFYNNEIVYPKNYVNYKVLDNGPLRSSFSLFYDNWKVGNSNVNVTKTIQLDAGSQLNKFDIIFSSTTLDSLPIVAGIHESKVKGADIRFLDEKKGIIGYWDPTIPEFGNIGVGCVFNGTNKVFNIEKDHLLNFEYLKINNLYSYYAGGGWDKAGEFKSALIWFNYLNNFSDQLKVPLTYTIK